MNSGHNSPRLATPILTYVSTPVNGAIPHCTCTCKSDKGLLTQGIFVYSLRWDEVSICRGSLCK